MKLIDTHTHIYLPEFDNDRDEVIGRAVANGIVKLLMPNIDAESVGKMLGVEKKFPGICHSMTGLHPTSVKEDFRSQLEQIKNLEENHKFCAIGEIGIDMYWDKSFLEEQVTVFREQVGTALDRDLPVVIHSRESFPEVFAVLEEFRGSGLKGVFHAFSGTESDAEKAIEMGFMLGIGGPLTFKNSGLAAIVDASGIENIILETDSPYLAPVPHRGRRNESSYICIINRKLAEIYGISEEESAAVTFANSVRLFNL